MGKYTSEEEVVYIILIVLAIGGVALVVYGATVPGEGLRILSGIGVIGLALMYRWAISFGKLIGAKKKEKAQKKAEEERK